MQPPGWSGSTWEVQARLQQYTTAQGPQAAAQHDEVVMLQL
jgi:hypothetical protein